MLKSTENIIIRLDMADKLMYLNIFAAAQIKLC